MFLRARGHLQAAQHAGDLLHPLLIDHRRDGGVRAAPVGDLHHPQVPVALSCHLRQVRDAQYLGPISQRAQLPADHFGDRTADAGVHLIEHHAAQLTGGAGDLDGQRKARKLAAGGHLGQGAQGLTRIGGNPKLDLVQPLWLRFGGLVRLHVDLEAPTAHAQTLHALGDVLAKRVRGRGALAREPGGQFLVGRERLRLLAAPGITGWAQIRGGYASNLSESEIKLGCDLYYLKHRSLALDLQILLRTVWTVVSGAGAR